MLAGPGCLDGGVKSKQIGLIRDARDQRAREFGGRTLAAEIARADEVDIERRVDRLAQACRLFEQLAMFEHHRRRQQQGRGICDAASRDFGRGTMDGLEDRRIGADVAAGCHAEAADQPRDEIRENVAEQIGGHQDVELPGIQNQLHRTGVDDHGFQRKPALVFLFIECKAGLEEDPGQRLHDVGLVDDRDFLAPRCDRMFEGEFQQPSAALARIDPGRHGDRMRIVVDGDVMLVADVEPLEVLTHDDEIDVVESTARDDRARGT